MATGSITWGSAAATSMRKPGCNRNSDNAATLPSGLAGLLPGGSAETPGRWDRTTAATRLTANHTRRFMTALTRSTIGSIRGAAYQNRRFNRGCGTAA